MTCYSRPNYRTGDVVEFGNTNEQKTPGVLLYYYEPVTIQIRYIRPNREQRTANVTLNRTYEDVSSLCDGPLQTGLLRRPAPLLLPTVVDNRTQENDLTVDVSLVGIVHSPG